MNRRRRMIPQFIQFEDPEVERICVSNWGRNGGLTREQAAMVNNTQFYQKFNNNRTIVSFNEYKYFTGLTKANFADFYDCSNLQSIELPDSITVIDDNAFDSCTNLSHIMLPSGLTTIKSCSFSGCSKLVLTSLPDSLNSIGGNSFRDSSVAIAATPSHLTAIEIAAFIRCYSLTNLVLNEGLLTIGDGSFSGCSNLVLTSIPRSVTYVGPNAFYNCKNIPYLHLLRETPFNINGAPFSSTGWEIYVGDGSSESHDNAILADYQSASNWSQYASRLDTWYNYLHSN